MKKYVLFGEGSDTQVLFRELVTGQSDGTGEQLKPLDQCCIVSHDTRIFEDMWRIHINGGHCKSRSFYERIKQRFGKSIPEKLVHIFVDSCPICTERKVAKTTSAGHKPILTSGMGVRGQVDLIDLQSCPDGSFKYLLNYQDHGIKLYESRPLTSKRNIAVAYALLDIFSLIGPPAILHTDNGREFSGVADSASKTKQVVLSDDVSFSLQI